MAKAPTHFPTGPILIKEGDSIVGEIAAERCAMPALTDEDYHLAYTVACAL